MGSFSVEWLTLREPADAAARSVRLTKVAAGFPRARELHVLDLGSGTGANLRSLAEHLCDHQKWLLVDHDAALLECVPALTAPWGRARGYGANQTSRGFVLEQGSRIVEIRTRSMDLVVIEDVAGIVPDGGLVTASALLDLVSESWLRQLAAACHERRAAALFALTYDGRFSCDPEEPEDPLVRALVNQHQRTDKGFGPALGPDAADCAEHCFKELGFEVEREPSDWSITPGSPELQRKLIEGWGEAAVQMAPDRSATIRGWLVRRLAHLALGRSRLTVGHQDVVALPAG